MYDTSGIIVKEIMEKRHQILEEFCKAYLAETGAMPSEVTLVEERYADRYEWHFELLKDRKIIGDA